MINLILDDLCLVFYLPLAGSLSILDIVSHKSGNFILVSMFAGGGYFFSIVPVSLFMPMHLLV